MSITARSSRAAVTRLSSSSLRIVASSRRTRSISLVRCAQLLLAVAKLDELRRHLLPFVLDFCFELGDGLYGGRGRADAIHPDRRVLRCA